MISVIIPSRLAANPNGDDELWLDRAVNSVMRQTERVGIEIVVAMDAGAVLPERFRTAVASTSSPGTGQAAAVNAGMRVSHGDVVAILEDDDYWEPDKLAAQLPFLQEFDLVTSNQREVTDMGNFVRINDFPTPSGWLMKRETWEKMGGFDLTFKYHVDTEWLGRANKAGLKRVHLTEVRPGLRPWLENIGRYSAITSMGNRDPLVVRTCNTKGGMATIERDLEASARSMEEHAIMMKRFGCVPW